MARVNGPLMGLDASGSVADTLTWSKWKGRNYVRQLVTPANPKSALQVSVRAIMRFLSTSWTHVTAADKALWATLAAQQTISNFDAYTQYNANRWTQSNSPVVSPTEPAGTVPVMGATTATPGKGQIAFSQVITTLNNIWGILITLSTTTGYTPGRANLRYAAYGIASPIAATVIGLTAGTWYYRIAGFNEGGTTSAYIAEASAVVT